MTSQKKSQFAGDNILGEADSSSPFNKKNFLVYENSIIGCMVIKSLKQ